MYINHNHRINKWAITDADQLAHTVMMVVLSIQQPWHSVGMQLKDMRKQGMKSRFVWGNKRKTYMWLTMHKDELYNNVIRANTEVEQLLAYLDVPGLGLPKAGFMVQLAHGGGGCLDIHNIRRYKLDPKTLAWSNPKTEALRIQKAQDYIELCSELGGSMELWDRWCNLIAEKNPVKFTDGHHVSAVHLSYLTDSYNNVTKEAV